MHANLLKLSLAPYFSWALEAIKSGRVIILVICMYVYLLLYQSLYDLTNPLGRRPISALVLTTYLRCHMILLILLCLVAPFLNSPRLFLFSINL